MKLSGYISNSQDVSVIVSKGADRTVVFDSTKIVDGQFNIEKQVQDTCTYLFTLKPSGNWLKQYLKMVQYQ